MERKEEDEERKQPVVMSRRETIPGCDLYWVSDRTPASKVLVVLRSLSQSASRGGSLPTVGKQNQISANYESSWLVRAKNELIHAKHG